MDEKKVPLGNKLEALTYTIEETAQPLRIGRNHCYEAVKRGDKIGFRDSDRLHESRFAARLAGSAAALSYGAEIQ